MGACLILSAEPCTQHNMKGQSGAFDIFGVNRGQTVGTGRCSCHGGSVKNMRSQPCISPFSLTKTGVGAANKLPEQFVSLLSALQTGIQQREKDRRDQEHRAEAVRQRFWLWRGIKFETHPLSDSHPSAEMEFGRSLGNLGFFYPDSKLQIIPCAQRMNSSPGEIPVISKH